MEFKKCPVCGRSLNYEPALTNVLPGALVVCDTDEKSRDMLMEVLDVDGHRAVTRYVHRTMRNGVPLTRSKMTFRTCDLHDPKRWNIDTTKARAILDKRAARQTAKAKNSIP